jgi:WD40 repeat protein
VKGGAWGILFSPDVRRLITTTSRGEVSIWSIPDGARLAGPVELPTMIQPAELSRDGRFFATGSTDHLVRLWDSTTGQPLWKKPHGSEINSVAFSPEGRLVASAGEDRIVRLWDTATGALVRDLKGHQNEVMTVIFSPDGRRLLTGSLDFTACLWDVATGRRLAVLPHQGEVLDAVFSPDGRYVATASRDRTAVLWDASTGLPHSRALLHEQGVRNVSFSPDGKQLLTLDFRGLRLWDVATCHPLTVHLAQTMQGGTGFQSSSGRPDFTPDGQAVLVALDAIESQLWSFSTPPAGAPAWFPEFLEAVAGQRFAAGVGRPEAVPPESFLTIERALRNSKEADYYTRWACAWLAGAKVSESAAKANGIGE